MCYPYIAFKEVVEREVWSHFRNETHFVSVPKDPDAHTFIWIGQLGPDAVRLTHNTKRNTTKHIPLLLDTKTPTQKPN